MPRSGPSETSEQRQLVAALRRAGVYFTAIPMGGARARGSGRTVRAEGAQKGFPDLLVFDWPSQHGKNTLLPYAELEAAGTWSRVIGVAIELKRPVRGSGPEPEQVEHLEKLAARGWVATVQWGAEEALAFLRRLGYPV